MARQHTDHSAVLTSVDDHVASKARKIRANELTECIYFASDGGHLHFSTPDRLQLATPMTAVIYISVGDTPHTIGDGYARRTHHAGVIRAVGHWISAEAPSLLAAHINPTHPHYRRLQATGGSGALTLEHQAYSTLMPTMTAAAHGRLSLEEASHLFDEIVERSVLQLPKAPCDATLCRELLDCVRGRPDDPLREFAREIGLPYERASRVFKEVTGITLRSYCVWRKLHRTRVGFLRDKTLTEIAHDSGFTDLAHMTHIHQRTYGFPPSRIFRRSCVLMVGPRDSLRL